MSGRARIEERAVTIEYISELHQLHEDWVRGIQMSNEADETDLPVS